MADLVDVGVVGRADVPVLAVVGALALVEADREVLAGVDVLDLGRTSQSRSDQIVRCSWKMNFESHIRLKRERTRMRSAGSSSSVMPPSGLSLTLIVSQQVGVEASSSKLTSNEASQLTFSAPVVSSRDVLLDGRRVRAREQLRDGAVAGAALEGEDVAGLRERQRAALRRRGLGAASACSTASFTAGPRRAARRR